MPGALENFAEFQPIALALVEVGNGRRKGIEGLEFLGSLHALAYHVDRSYQLAAFGRIIGEHLGQVELAVAGFAQQAAADLLGAIIPESGIEPGIPPADRAIALNIANKICFRRLRGQSGESDDQGHGGGASFTRASDQAFGRKGRLVSRCRGRG